MHRATLFHTKADGPRPPAPADADLVRDAVARLLGERVALAPLAGGTRHRAYRVQGRGLVARVSDDADAMRLDRYAAARLRAAGLPAVDVVALEATRWPFAIELLAEAPGVSLSTFDDDEATLEPLLERLGAFLARVHSLDADGYGLLCPSADGENATGGVANWHDYLCLHLDRHLGVCREIGAIDAHEEGRIRRAFRDAESLSYPARLLHGDPGSPNVFVAGGEIAALIDWEDALAGDPAYEVALWATFHPERRHAAFLRGYQSESIDDVAERFWPYYLRAALAKTVARHDLGLRDAPGREPASRRIQLGLMRWSPAFERSSEDVTPSKDRLKAGLQLARRVRAHVLRMVHRARASHVGSCFSCADLLAVLYADVLRHRPEQPDWPRRDRLIVSKGHAAAAVYAALAEAGYFPASWLDRFCEDGTCLAGHVHHGVPGVEVSTGSLGHGLPLACGMALAAKVDGLDSRVFALLSDGECDEGATWEAALFAPHQKLDNLTVVVDHNRIQSLGRVADVLDLHPFADKWRSFGWHVVEVDGHDHAAIRAALSERRPDRPTAVLAHTVKGKGVSFMQDELLWHYRSPNDDELSLALAEIEGTPCG